MQLIQKWHCRAGRQSDADTPRKLGPRNCAWEAPDGGGGGAGPRGPGARPPALGGWLARGGRRQRRAVMAQGTAMGRAGRVHLTRDNVGRLTVGSAVQILVEGTVTL